MLGIQDLLERKPKQLSGGQRQRVAVGRAIVREPRAFLFDEPLSNLDAKLRVTTRGELKALHQRLKTTTIYVTHDQEEAMTLGDRIVVMSNGLIQQAGAPLDVYRHPVNRFVAGFVGTPPMNFIEGTIRREDGRVYFREHSALGEGIKLAVAPAHEEKVGAYDAKPLVLGLRPQSLAEARGGEDPDRTIQLKIHVVEPLGDSMDLSCTTPTGRHVVVRVPSHGGLQPGATARFVVEMTRAHLFEPGDFGACVTAWLVDQ